jgi:hypothetical protein
MEFFRSAAVNVVPGLLGAGVLAGLAACGTGQGAAGQGQGGANEKVAVIAAAHTVGPATAAFPSALGPDAVACGRTVAVADGAGLSAAVAGAQPGDCIVLADGDYSFPVIGTRATEAKPIAIRAAHRGRATVSAGSIVLRNASWIMVEGLHFVSAGSIKLIDSQHCRISRMRIQPEDTPDVDWVEVTGTSHHIRIDHNDFGPKSKVGNMVMLSGAGGQVVQFNQIDHNYFHDITYGGGNGWETIRAGLSHLAPSKAFTVIESNLFRNTAGDPETISIKSSDNEIRFNTFRDVPGELTLRHGNRNRVHGNYILGGGNGIRVCGADHLIYNNYIAGVKSGRGIWLEGGDGDGTDVPGKQHYRVYRTQVVNNTVIGARIDVGGGHPLEPVDCTVANNISSSIRAGGTGTRYAANLTSAGPGSGAASTSVVVGGIEKLAAGSPAVDAAVGQFAFVSDDIDGQPRDGQQPSKNDVGADELSDAPITAPGPLTEQNVGPDSP